MVTCNSSPTAQLTSHGNGSSYTKVAAAAASITFLSAINSFSAQWVGTNTLYPPGSSQEWQVGTNWQVGSPPPAGEFVLIGQNTNPNQPVVAYLNTATNAVQSVANLYGSHFVIGSSGVLNLQTTEGRVEIGKFGAASTLTVMEGGQIIGGTNRAIEVWQDDLLQTAGIISHRALVIKSGNATAGTTGGTVNMTGGSLTLNQSYSDISIGESSGTGGLFHQSGGTISAASMVITTGQFRISGGTISLPGSGAVGANALHFGPTTEQVGTTGGSIQVVGSAGSMSFAGYRNDNNIAGRIRPTFSFILNNSAGHISKINLAANGSSGATLRDNAKLEVGLAGGVLLSGTNAFTLIDRAATGNGDTAWSSGPNALWTDTTNNVASKELITIGLNVAQDKGNLDGSGFNPTISFAASNLGYVDLLNMSTAFKLGLDVTGGDLNNFTNALTAAGIVWNAGSGGVYEVELNFDPTVSGGNYFAWDLSTIDSNMGIQGLAVIPEPSAALLFSGALFALAFSRRRRSSNSGH